MYEITTTLRFNAWSDWCDFLNGLLDRKVLSWDDLESRGFTSFEDGLTIDEDPDEYPEKVLESHLAKENLSFGTYSFWMEKTYDRLGPVGIFYVQRVPDNPSTPSEWFDRIDNAERPEERHVLGFFTA